MRQMNVVRGRSRLTSSGSPAEHRAAGRPRLQLEFSSAGRRRSVEPVVLATSGDPREPSSYYIEVLFKALSEAVAAEGVPSALGTIDRDAKSLKLRLDEAFEVDLAVAIGAAKETPKGYAPLVPLLKAWTRKTADSRRIFISHVLDATLDPLTWRTAHEDVGPRPAVNVFLLVPGNHDTTAADDPLDIAIVYRGAGRAGEEVEELAAAMTPDVPVPTPPVVLQARRNAEARTALLEEFGALTAAEVADLAGSEAKNTSALAGRWRREGRLLAVTHHGTLFYPGFQFDSSGKPKPVIAGALQYLGSPDVTDWQRALWFTSANGWLGGRRPVDVLDDEGDAVVAAARDALREPVG